MPEIYEFEAEWRALDKRAADGTAIFQSFAWCAVWAETFANRKDSPEICVVSVRNHGELVLVWPLMKVCVGPFCVLRWLGEPHGQYGNVVADPALVRDTVFDAAWRHIVSTAKADVIWLRHVREDSAICSYLQRNCRISDTSQSAPYLDLADLHTEDDFKARYNKQQLRRRRRITKQLESKLGVIEFDRPDDVKVKSAAFDLAIEQKSEWLNERGLFSDAFRYDGFADFLKRLSAREDENLKVCVSQMNAGAQIVSYQVGFDYFGRHLCYLTTHDPRYTDLSPGRVHMDHMQCQVINAGMQAFDLMVPNDPHKNSWSNGTIPVFDFFSETSLRGKLFGKTYLSTLRPLVRKAYKSVPAKVRSRLLSLI